VQLRIHYGIAFTIELYEEVLFSLFRENCREFLDYYDATSVTLRSCGLDVMWGCCCTQENISRSATCCFLWTVAFCQ